MMLGMFAAFLTADGTGRCTRFQLRLQCALVVSASAADEQLDSRDAGGGAVGVQANAIDHRTHIVFGQTGIRAGGTCEKTVEARLNAFLDALGRLLRVIAENLQSVIHESFLSFGEMRTAFVTVSSDRVAQLPRGRTRKISNFFG